MLTSIPQVKAGFKPWYTRGTNNLKPDTQVKGGTHGEYQPRVRMAAQL